MTGPSLLQTLTAFRRQLTLIRVIRVGIVVAFLVAILLASGLEGTAGRRAIFLLAMAAMACWLWLAFTSVRVTRSVQATAILIATGQLDRAESWLRSIITRFSLSAHAKLLACHQLATLLLRREAYEDVVTVCRELLRAGVGGLQAAATQTRLMLADSLLMLGRPAEAYDALRPIYDQPLSLADRMKLLPIQLRYELAANHSGSAVRDLREKVRIAALLEPERAALAHALLAEACRREGMEPQRDFLARRAELYGDMVELARKYPVLGPPPAATGETP